jgi:nucleoid-associated protein YgaU
MFFQGSRYATVGEAELIDRQGRVIRYKRIRFIPPTPAQVGHRVSQGERLDQIAFRYYRDPERFWRICDANLAMLPEDLVSEVGRTIQIPPAEG